ncbi:MAG: hypothetical protein V5A55_09055, partial [Halovenus sp.]
ADGWLAAPGAPDTVAADWAEIAAHLEKNGREPTEVDRVALNRAYVVPGADPDIAREKQRRVFGNLGSAEDTMERCLTGSVEEIGEAIAQYREMGFDELVLDPATNDPADAERQLRLYEEQVDELV